MSGQKHPDVIKPHTHENIRQGGVLKAHNIAGVPSGGLGGSTGGGGSEGGSGISDLYLTRKDGGGDIVEDHSSSGSTETIDPANGNVHEMTLTADCTVTLTGPTTGRARLIEVYAYQDGTGGWAITWPASVFWPGDTDPVPDTTADTVTRYLFETLDGGTIWYGSVVGAGGSVDAATISALGFVGQILISDTPSTPLVFADLIQNEAQDDLVYADL